MEFQSLNQTVIINGINVSYKLRHSYPVGDAKHPEVNNNAKKKDPPSTVEESQRVFTGAADFPRFLNEKLVTCLVPMTFVPQLTREKQEKFEK